MTLVTRALSARRVPALMLALVLGATLLPATPAAAANPRPMVSRPGQLKIVSVNARQNAVLGIKRFEDMFELTRALRRRPPAFDGGSRGGVWAPDIIVTTEMRPSNAEIFEHIMRQRFPHKFRLAGYEDASGQIIYNPDTVSPVGEVEVWQDVCLADKTSGARQGRFYQIARFVELGSGAPFTVAAIHMPKSLPEPHCFTDNIDEMKSRTQNDAGAVFITGDFNRRAVEMHHECDPQETSPPLPWYQHMVFATEQGPAFEDAVILHQRRIGASLKDQWTHEQKQASIACDGGTKIRRTRIDYLFSTGATVAEASADHPGWAGPEPGTKHPENHKYSDHRFIWGRFALGSVGRTGPPRVAAARGGRIDVSWDALEGAVGYVVFRGFGRRALRQVATVGAEVTTYSDISTTHGQRYRYAIAPINSAGGHGHESSTRGARADSRGPQVVGVNPPDGATGVARIPFVEVTLDEPIAATSLQKGDRLELYRGSQRIWGKVTQIAPNMLRFRPANKLRRRTLYTARLRPLQDPLGNVGAGYTWSFRTRRAP